MQSIPQGRKGLESCNCFNVCICSVWVEFQIGTLCGATILARCRIVNIMRFY